MNETRPEPMGFTRTEKTRTQPHKYTAHERAVIRGWAVTIDNAPPPPHAFGAQCTDKQCLHRGRSVVHYRRA